VTEIVNKWKIPSKRELNKGRKRGTSVAS